jgi:TolA-binding protein
MVCQIERRKLEILRYADFAQNDGPFLEHAPAAASPANHNGKRRRRFLLLEVASAWNTLIAHRSLGRTTPLRPESYGTRAAAFVCFASARMGLRLRSACVAATALAIFLFDSDEARAQVTAAETASQQALALFNAGQIPEATEAYKKILHDYPTSTVVSEAQFRLGYLDYLQGDYDPALDLLKKLLAPPAPADIQELAASLLPQVMSANATKFAPDNPARTRAFEEAIKQFDLFIQKFPKSEELEGAVYGRALALFQTEKYDDAATALRGNLARFPKSGTILDSEYLLALTLATQANRTVQSADGEANAGAQAKYDEAARLLGDIITKGTDVALANDAQFQIGELMFARAATAGKAAQPPLFANAMAAYRAVEPREAMAKVQEARVNAAAQRLRTPEAIRDAALGRRLQRQLDRERAKLAAIQTKPDQTVAARIKIGTIFFLQQKYDEARVLLRQMQQFAQDDEQKKTILYYITLTYAAQNLVDKAVAGYDEFQSGYKGAPIADNLPVAIGSLFVASDPQRAIGYFREAAEIYPRGRFANEALVQQGLALVQLKRGAEALPIFKKILDAKPTNEIAAPAETGLATIYAQTGKIDEALAAFKAVREKYPGTPQAAQAGFNIGGLALQKHDAKTALAELEDFIAKNPDSALMGTAKFYLGVARQMSGDKAAALELFNEVLAKYPKSEVAPSALLQIATIHQSEQKTAEMQDALRQFIERYPNSDKIFAAYDRLAQTQINEGRLPDGIASYLEVAEQHPRDPQAADALLKASEWSKRYAESQGRYLALNEEQRAEWNKGVTGSIDAAEKLVQQFPDGPQVTPALETMLADQRLLAGAKLKTDAEVEQYFADLAKNFESSPATASKVIFALASFVSDKDKAKALDLMAGAYDPKLVYAPAALDLYGSALIEQGKVANAKKVYEKLAADYPNPPGVAAEKAPRQIAEAQATALYGIGRCFQKQDNVSEAAKRFEKLKTLYPWSPKILEADFGIAQSLLAQKKYDEALKELVRIIRAPAATAELRANAMLLGGEIHERKGNLEPAIDYYIKIAAFYEGVPATAAEGLWHGGQLLEKQSAALSDPAKKTAQRNKAIKAYKDLVEKYPASPFATKAKDRLELLEK